MSLNGWGTRTIANRLNEKGVPTRKNKLFRPHTIQGMIKNPIYKGDRVYSGEVFKSPAIVSPEYWQKVNDNLDNNRTHSGKKVEYKYLLKGLIECFKCGHNYYGRKRANNTDNFYMCSSKRFKDLNCNSRGVNIDILDSVIWEVVIRKGKLKEHIIQQHNKSAKDSNNTDLITKRNKIKQDVSKVDKQVLNSLDLIASSDDLDDDTRLLFNNKISTLQKARKALKNDLKAVEKELQVFDEMTKNIDEKLKGFIEIENYSNLTFDIKRNSLESVIDTIKVMDLKNSRHTLLLIKPKLAYEVTPMIVIMNYSKDYALVENFENPFVYSITSKGLEKYKNAKILDAIEEARELQIEYAIEKVNQ